MNENIPNGGVTPISMKIEKQAHMQIYLAIVCAIREDTIGVWYCSFWSEGSINPLNSWSGLLSSGTMNGSAVVARMQDVDFD